MRFDTLTSSIVGNSPVLWLLGVLSLFALTIAVERAIVLGSSRDDIARLQAELQRLLARGERGIALGRLEASPSYEARIVAAAFTAQSSASAEERMLGERALARLAMQQNLGFLRAIGFIAPILGVGGAALVVLRALWATEIGAMDVREATALVMGSALVAAPAIALAAAFERVVQNRIARADALARDVLSYLEPCEATR